jgi:hypothetical protein
MLLKRRSLGGLVAVVCLLSFPMAASADAGIPMLPVKYPEILLFLIPVILIEWAYLQSQLHSRWVRTFTAVLGVNTLTTALGYPLAWALYAWLDRSFGFPAGAMSLNGHVAAIPVWICTRVMPQWGGAHAQTWPVLLAFVVLLGPSYLFSGLLKAWILSLYDLLSSKGNSRRAIWNANRLSYLFLATVGCVLLYTMYNHG